MEFFICKHCGNVVAYVERVGPNIVCCGEAMTTFVPNTMDAAIEKHVPIIQKDDNKVTVTVGSARHPMVEEHHIAWISLQTMQGNQRKELQHTGDPQAVFMLADGDEPISAYARCNIHGLWKNA